jgi:heat-inducible transcriptional repressor
MVTASYHIVGEVVGSIAVLGPTRMEYDKVITVVRFMAESLSELLTRLNRGV